MSPRARGRGGERDMASPSPTLLLIFLFLAVFFPLYSCDPIHIRDINLENPILQLTPTSIGGFSSSHKDSISCERVHVVGLSRMQLTSYPNSFHVLVNASDEMPERHHKKVDLCFHRNASAGLCQCGMEHWRNLNKGQLSMVMSPYDTKFIDFKFSDGISGPVIISVEEEMQHWRLFFLGLGFLLLLLAPVISNWVPFYYSSSMVLGVFLVIIVLLFQGMKLLPTGRKSFIYLTLYGSVLGLGSLLTHYFSTFVNSVLASFGLSEEMHNPVSVFLLTFIILSGAALGFWIVRKFVLSEDGGVDTGIAQFVKWAMRTIAMMFVFQSSHDSMLATAALLVCWKISSLITSWSGRKSAMLQHRNPTRETTWQQTARVGHKHVEFSSPIKGRLTKSAFGGGQSRAHGWSNSPAKGMILSRLQRAALPGEQEYYSTFHRTPTRKFSKKEWDAFTQESTRNALAQWASSPQVGEWLTENVHRIHLSPKNHSDTDDAESSSGSSEEVVEDRPGFFGWL